MEKWRKWLAILMLLIIIVALVGCARTRIIDKISIIHVFGIDEAENGDLIGTALFPQYTRSKDSDEIQYLSEQASSGVLFGPKMAAYTSTPVELAKIRVLLFGKSFAEAGVADMVERFMVNPQIATNIQIAASTHPAMETLNTFKTEQSLTLAERIRQNMVRQSLPSMNLHVFLNHFYGEGIDAYVPMLTINEKNIVKVEGLGVFKDDKLKLQLNPEQTVLFSFITDEKTQATYQIVLDENNRSENIALKAFRSDSKWDWNRKKEQLKLHLQLQVTITQFPEKFKDNKVEDMMEMQQLIEETLETGIGELLTTFKENDVDPLGIGNIVRAQDLEWEAASFYELYPNLPVDVKVDLQILHSGLES